MKGNRRKLAFLDTVVFMLFIAVTINTFSHHHFSKEEKLFFAEVRDFINEGERYTLAQGEAVEKEVLMIKEAIIQCQKKTNERN